MSHINLGLPLVFWIGACAQGEPVRVLDAANWVIVTDRSDPWALEAPPDADCSQSSFFEEEGYFEVSMEGCSWGTWTQPIPDSLNRGAQLEVELFHQDLWAPLPATAVVELAIGPDVVVEWSAAIPTASGRYDLFGRAPRNLEGPAFLHVHNHGLNSYRVGDVFAR
ncbi:MAG: hypothetical protein AAGA48_07520 [Myxococcota bacterium]